MRRPLVRGPVACALLAAGLAAAGAWAVSVHRGAHLLHFDAKAHLLVARRTLDSLTPGWTQLGAVWLPLPHMLNALPSQVDALYATGLAASTMSFVFFMAGLWALGRAAERATGDAWAGVVALSVPALNPGWLYLQSTPLVEALFLACVSGALAGLVFWHLEERRRVLWAATACSALACWVRYEAWPLMTVVMAWTTVVAPGTRRRRTAGIALGLGVLAPILLYGAHAWAATGVPFHAIGSENLYDRRGDLGRALGLAFTGLRDAFGPILLLAGVGALAVLARRLPRDPLAALALAAWAPLCVTLIAYLAGHPPKARYPLLVAPAIALALARATTGRIRLQVAVLVIAACQAVSVPWPLPVIREATRDHQDVTDRGPVLDAFRGEYEGGRILASMGSLAPVLFELGQRGLPLREIVHEGNGRWWENAVVDPSREVRWVVVRRGDILDHVRQVRACFPEGFVPVFCSGRVIVYGRAPEKTAGPAVLAREATPYEAKNRWNQACFVMSK